MVTRNTIAVMVVMLGVIFAAPPGMLAQERGDDSSAPASDARLEQITTKLDTLKVSVDFDNTSLEDVVKTFAEISRIDFLVDRTVRERAKADDLAMTIKLTDIVLSSALKLVFETRGLACVYKDGVLLVVHKDALRTNVVMRIYDVRDMMTRIKDFPGPEITLAKGTVDVVNPLIPEDAKNPVTDPDFLINMVRSNTGKDSWEANSKAAISIANGLMVVCQTPDVQEEISKLIGLLRQYK
jgi:hypothetical protein